MTKPTIWAIERHMAHFATRLEDPVHLQYFHQQMELLQAQIGETENVGREKSLNTSMHTIPTWDRLTMSRPAANATNPVGQFRRVDTGTVTIVLLSAAGTFDHKLFEVLLMIARAAGTQPLTDFGTDAIENYVMPGNSDDDEDGEPHCPGGSAGPEDTMELESNTEFHFEEFAKRIAVALQSNSRREALPRPSSAVVLHEDFAVSDIGREALSSSDAPLSERLKLNESTRRLYGYVVDWRMGSRAATALFQLMRSPGFDSTLVSTSDVQGLHKRVLNQYRQCMTKEVNFTRAEDGKNHCVFYYKDIVDCVAELVGDKELVRTMSFAPDVMPTDEHKHGLFKNGAWWRSFALQMPQGTTLIPVILYSDKSFFLNTEAYPLYATIGNIEDFTRLRSKAWRLVGIWRLVGRGCATSYN